ncbi:unnamed protein product [Danaus chrysippus]|uniref:(African queen) hypothetical protein n=1 Tax=Danaus chrysippus TaxID=151541 RepID=A0A8J2W2N6_9NEOP|nr:unnamed protein product [Danaus chrysippus]
MSGAGNLIPNSTYVRYRLNVVFCVDLCRTMVPALALLGRASPHAAGRAHRRDLQAAFRSRYSVTVYCIGSWLTCVSVTSGGWRVSDVALDDVCASHMRRSRKRCGAAGARRQMSNEPRLTDTTRIQRPERVQQSVSRRPWSQDIMSDGAGWWCMRCACFERFPMPSSTCGRPGLSVPLSPPCVGERDRDADRDRHSFYVRFEERSDFRHLINKLRRLTTLRRCAESLVSVGERHRRAMNNLSDFNSGSSAA